MKHHRRPSVDRDRFAQAMAALTVAVRQGACAPTEAEARAIRVLCRRYKVESPVSAVRPAQRGRA